MTDESTGAASTVPFHYIKSAFFRSIHMDGLIGGVTPNGHIHCAIYSERPAIPQRTEYPLRPDGSLDEEGMVTEGKPGIVRELDADIFFNKQTALLVKDWLEKSLHQLEEWESATAAMQAKKNDNV